MIGSIRTILFILFGIAVFDTAAARCPGAISVEVLGSGGPIADDGRAGSGYLVWIDGKAKFLIDAGGGVFLRYGESGAKIADHDAILISHFHADHIADLPAILKSGFFTKRNRPLPLIGPSGNKYFPGASEWVSRMFDKDTGAYRYLTGYLTGTPRLGKLEPADIDTTAEDAVTVFESERINAIAIPVNHGGVPALGYLIEIYGKRIIFAGDQSSESDFFVEYLKDTKVDLLVAHHVIPQANGGQPIGLHRSPRQIGEMAATIGARHLVLSHNMARSMNSLETGLAAISESFDGPVSVAEDHSCFTVQ